MYRRKGQLRNLAKVKPTITDQLSVGDLKETELEIVKHVQRGHFSDEVKTFQM